MYTRAGVTWSVFTQHHTHIRIRQEREIGHATSERSRIREWKGET